MKNLFTIKNPQPEKAEDFGFVYIQKLFKFKYYSKLNTTYIDVLIKLIN